MPFLRYTRDKRGFETTLIMHAYRSPSGGSQNRVLYLFRSPSHVTVGRRALDDEAKEALEHMHPDLTFDWVLLGREQTTPRADHHPQKPRREGRGSGPSHGSSHSQQPAPVAIDDQSVLGRTLGGGEAARLRRRYAELLQRITRRARTPEERDQLVERAHRLNPDDWSDEQAVRAGIGGLEAGWDELAQEVPHRRRGRRGGHQRRENRAAGPSGQSVILTEGGGADEGEQDGEVVGPDRDAGTAGDGDRPGPGADPGGATGDGFPGDD